MPYESLLRRKKWRATIETYRKEAHKRLAGERIDVTWRMFSYAINVDGDGRVSLSKRNKQRDIVRSTVSICSTILQLPTATLAGLTKQLYYSCAINIHTLTRSPAVKRHH